MSDTPGLRPLMSATAPVTVGWRAREVVRELPELRVLSCEASLRGSCLRASPQPLREQLAALSDRFNGAKAIAVRGEAVPAAYRALFHAVGLDPDRLRTPIEEAVFSRMFDGAFLSQNLLDDVLLIALVDTSVAVWALDADALEGELGLRTAGEREQLRGAEQSMSLAGGELVIADETRALALLGTAPAQPFSPRRSTRRVRLFALEFAGISELAVHEALWIACSALDAQG
jgi:hypothetical protein